MDFQTAIHKGHRLESLLCRLLLGGFMLTLMAQLAGRLMGVSLAGGEELARTVFVYFAYTSAAYATRLSVHARLSAHLRRLPPRVARLCLFAGDAVWLAFNGLMCVKGVEAMLTLRAFPYTTPVLGWQLSWVYAVFPLTFGLMALHVLHAMIQRLRSPAITKGTEGMEDAQELTLSSHPDTTWP